MCELEQSYNEEIETSGSSQHAEFRMQELASLLYGAKGIKPASFLYMDTTGP